MESSLFLGLCLGIILGLSMGFYMGLTFRRKPNERESNRSEPVKKAEKVKLLKVRKGIPKDSLEEIARQQALIQEQIALVKKAADSSATESNNANRERAKKFNNECSNCGHKTVVDEIKYDPNGKSHTVRKCTGCGNEWEPKDYSYAHEQKVIEDWLVYIRRFLDDVKDEKEDAYTGTWSRSIKRIWSSIAIETIWEISKAQPSYRSDHEKISKNWNPDALKMLGLRDIRYKEQEKRDITGILDDGH